MTGIGDRDRPGTIRAVGELTEAVYPGLDLSQEMEAVLAQRLGDIVLIDDQCGLASGSHLSHRRRDRGRRRGPATSSSGPCGRVLVRSEVSAGWWTRVTGWRPTTTRRSWWPARMPAGTAPGGYWPIGGSAGSSRGVAMHRPNEAGYSRSDSYVIDDWR